eukprot:5923421-Pleurochrysis_carterae.AAC.1
MPRVARVPAATTKSDAAPTAAKEQHKGTRTTATKQVSSGMRVVTISPGLTVKCDLSTLIKLPEELDQPCCCLDA